jgi:hypothetical protein
MAFTRSATLLCFVAHLLLQAAAVPHFHDAAGDLPGHEHQGRPHIHLGGHGHHHEDGHRDTAPIVATPGDGEIVATAPCCCHDDDAFDVSIDTLLASPDWRTTWPDNDEPVSFGLPAIATDVSLSPFPDCQGWGFSRPPGDRTPTVHDLLPHVLRI